MTWSRSFTGCGTCRSRHVKCDEARPECRKCQSLSIHCTGYKPGLFWREVSISPSQQSKNTDKGNIRQRLYSETQQKAMTLITSTSLGRLDVTNALDELELVFTSVNSISKPRLLDFRSKGPFGVLVVSPESSRLAATPLPVSQDGNSSGATRLTQTISPTTLEKAAELLRYFKHNAVPFSYALRQNISPCPWEDIHFPVAERVYARLLLYGSASFIDMSLFYSVLAISCYDLALGDKSPGSNSNEFGRQYKELARQHLDRAIQDEVASIIDTEYEHLLMALLSMTLLEIRYGQYNDAEYLLLEAEYLIRTRGLAKPQKSLQVRILHHIYTYLRILTESTCGCILQNVYPVRPTSTVHLVTAEARERLRSFRIAKQSTESDLRMSDIKPAAVAYDDIHLEVLGQWDESLFQQLYGVPECLLGLLSQTIRLANEQELMHRDTPIDRITVQTLAQRTRFLEHNILSWKPSIAGKSHFATLRPHSSTTGSPTCFDRHIQVAFHQAIILFFCRRVQNTNALMLQGVVRKVLEELRNASGPYDAAALLWPAFLAACEAIDMELRDGFRKWLRDMGNETHIPVFEAVVNVATKVWNLREKHQEYTLSWFDVASTEKIPNIAL